MMHRQNNKWYRKLRFLATLPVALLLIIACNQENLPTISEGTVVTGKVLNDEGTAFQGATIVVEGTNITTVSDAEGKYEIKVPSGDANKLVFSYNGINPVSMKVGKRSIIDVQLKSGNLTASGTDGEAATMDPASFTYDDKKVVSGKIMTADGKPMPGVNIIIAGTNRGSITDLEGRYKMVVPDKGGTMLYSFVGFNSERVSIADRSIIDVVLTTSGKLGTGSAFLPSNKKKGNSLVVISKELDRNGARFLSGRVADNKGDAIGKTNIFVLRDNKVISLGETERDGSFEVKLLESDSKVFFKHKDYSVRIRNIGN